MKILKILIIFLFSFVILIVINKIRYHYDWENASWHTLMTPSTGTIWAKGFSEENFLKVSVGMSQKEVLQIVGVPLEYDCGNKYCGFAYSKQDSPTADFDRRWIRFDLSGKVIEIYHDFYID